MSADDLTDNKSAESLPERKPWSTPRVILSEISRNTSGGPVPFLTELSTTPGYS